MSTKEVIEIVCVGREKLLTFSEAHKVVGLLQRGENFEKMWEEFGKEFRGIVVYGTGILISKGMDRIKQKYFPEKKVIK